MKLKDSNRLARKLFYQQKIRGQLYTMYFLTIVLPILIIGISLTAMNYHRMRVYGKELLQSDTSRAKNVIYEATSRIYKVSNSLIETDLVDGFVTDRTNRFMYQKQLLEQVENYETDYSEIGRVFVYTDMPQTPQNRVVRTIDEEVKQERWYMRAKDQLNVFWDNVYVEDTYGKEKDTVALIRRIPIVGSDRTVILMITVSDGYIRSRVDSGNYTCMFSVDGEDGFYCSDKTVTDPIIPINIDVSQKYFSHFGTTKWEGRKSFVHVVSVNAFRAGSRFYICNIDENGYVSAALILLICIAIILAAVVLPGIVMYFFSGFFVGRISTLRNEMHKASNRDYEITKALQGNDEISEAYSDLLRMVENIKAEEAKVYEATIQEKEREISTKEMELKMLSSQINPHFLYNTLETIRMKAFTAGDKEAASAIKLLGKSMRYVLDNTGAKLSTIEAELEHVDTYIKIQKMRFGDKFDFEVNLQEGIDAGHYSMLPLMLQPLVENAIVHGMEEVENGGKVTIDVYRKELEEPYIVIDVKDNGAGMNEEELMALRQSIETKDVSRSKSIGLYNINQRLQIHYGTGNRLHITSAQNEGTTIRVMLPERLL